MPDKTPYHCLRCKFQVAITDGFDLYFGVTKVPGDPLRIKMLCPNCQAPIKWNSLRDRRKTTSDRIVLTNDHNITQN